MASLWLLLCQYISDEQAIAEVTRATYLRAQSGAGDTYLGNTPVFLLSPHNFVSIEYNSEFQGAYC